MQAPNFPILSWANFTFPCVHKSWTVNAGYSWLNDATTFWQSGGIKGMEVGCGPAAVGRPVWVAAGIGTPGNFNGGPMNDASGHVSVNWMEQLSTSWQTVRPSAKQGRLSVVPALYKARNRGGRVGYCHSLVIGISCNSHGCCVGDILAMVP
jgi:hypothetical protein